MKEIKSINLLMKEDSNYSNYIKNCVNYSIKNIEPSRFHGKEKKLAFDKDNYNIFPYVFERALINIFNQYQTPDDFSLYIEGDMIVSDSEIRGIDNKVYLFLKSIGNESVKIEKKDNSGYLFTVNDKVYTINSNSFEIEIAQSLYRSGEDLRCCIKINSTNRDYPIYIVDPKLI